MPHRQRGLCPSVDIRWPSQMVTRLGLSLPPGRLQNHIYAAPSPQSQQTSALAVSSPRAPNSEQTSAEGVSNETNDNDVAARTRDLWGRSNRREVGGHDQQRSSVNYVCRNQDLVLGWMKIRRDGKEQDEGGRCQAVVLWSRRLDAMMLVGGLDFSLRRRNSIATLHVRA